MTLDYDCPYCTRVLSVEREAAGRDVLCPGCHVTITLPVPLRMTRREARRKLFPLASCLLMAGFVHLLVWCVVVFLLATSDKLPPEGVDDPVIFYLMAVITFLVAFLPGPLLLVAAWAMFRARNFRLALAGMTIAMGLGLCCCLPLWGLGIWGQSVLKDPLLQQAME